MKGGKEEDKITSPMFPRLHVNDADKGGPRAPPRNKMALYEQLCIPSQRFNSTSLPLPSQNARNLVPLASQGSGQERSVFSPFHLPPSASTYSAEKVNFHSTDGENMKTTRMEFGKGFTGHMNFKPSSASKSVAECSSLLPCDSAGAKNSFRKRVVVDDDDFMVPTFFNSENASYLNKDKTGVETNRATPPHANNPHNGCSAPLNSSTQIQKSCDSPLEQTNTSDIKTGKHERNCSGQKVNNTALLKEGKEKALCHPEAGEKLEEPLKSSKLSTDQGHTTIANVFDKTHIESRGICQESCGNGALDGSGCMKDTDGDENVLRVREETCLKASLMNNYRSSKVANNCNLESEDRINGFEQRDIDKNDEVSDTSMLDSISGLEISPDDVVGVIGPKQFWKARRAIVKVVSSRRFLCWHAACEYNLMPSRLTVGTLGVHVQQRVFAVQVFELHRLIKVQKLIAASPHLLLDENPCITPQKVPTENVPSEFNVKSQLQVVKQKDDFQKPNQSTTDCRTENPRASPLPPHDDGPNNGLIQPPRYGPSSGNATPVPPTRDNHSSPWCLQPPTNQWLVPVMSPSEGLIYKPYSGACPPAPGFMAPIYGNYNHLSLPPVYGVSSSHQQQNIGVLSGAPIAPNYFPAPYGLQNMTPNVSNSAVEQATPMTGPRPNGTNGQMEQNSRSSCNMTFPRSEAFTARPWKFHTSKGSELQGSTASSPCEKEVEGRSALPLFPMALAAEGSVQPSESNGKQPRAHVIKVVPHNARSATESAARIFRSIQEERQQFDS